VTKQKVKHIELCEKSKTFLVSPWNFVYFYRNCYKCKSYSCPKVQHKSM